MVAIDGPDCSGKTSLADAISAITVDKKIPCTVIHLDDTFEPTVRRPRSNPDPVSEFLLDYFRHDTIDGFLHNSTGLRIVEGMFLLRPQLMKLYDFRIRLELDEAYVFQRAMARDKTKFDSPGDLILHYACQALPAQRLYRWFCQPHVVADLTITLSDDSDAKRDVDL